MVLAAPRGCAKAPDTLGRVRQEISIQRLLEWAFADECASVDFEDAGTLAQGYGHIGNAHRMAQRGALGCRIDGGGRSEPHPDADLVSAAVAVLPEGCGGRSMAVQIAELARGRQGPSLHEGREIKLKDVPERLWSGVMRCEPAEMFTNKHGLQAATSLIDRGVDTSGLRARRYDVRVCPVAYMVKSPDIARARRNYLQWRLALMELRQTFVNYNNLSRWAVTRMMPPMRPWRNSV
jgi:hypothetical protein